MIVAGMEPAAKKLSPLPGFRRAGKPACWNPGTPALLCCAGGMPARIAAEKAMPSHVMQAEITPAPARSAAGSEPA